MYLTYMYCTLSIIPKGKMSLLSTYNLVSFKKILQFINIQDQTRIISKTQKYEKICKS